jgi:hypothetical protein
VLFKIQTADYLREKKETSARRYICERRTETRASDSESRRKPEKRWNSSAMMAVRMADEKGRLMAGG